MIIYAYELFIETICIFGPFLYQFPRHNKHMTGSTIRRRVLDLGKITVVWSAESPILWISYLNLDQAVATMISTMMSGKNSLTLAGYFFHEEWKMCNLNIGSLKVLTHEFEVESVSLKVA